MVELLKYLRGYLRIRVSGFSPERFMNLCSNKGILLWQIVREGDVYYMNINLKSFRALRPTVRKRKVFVAGLLLAVFFWMWSSLFIWNIELSGNYRITNDMFQSFLQENNVIVGMKKEELDIENLEKEIRRTFPEITWASAKLSGTRLLVDI